MTQLATLLLVEDDAIMVEITRSSLEQGGYRVILALDGEEALELLEQHGASIDLILSDVEMPNMDGLTLCHRVKANSHWAEIPFIFVSGHTSLEEKLQGYNAGGSDYITKPIDVSELIEKVRQLLVLRNQTRALQHDLQATQQAAMSAMSYSGYYGQIIRFYENSLHAYQEFDLAQIMLCTLKDLSLSASIHLWHDDRLVSYAQNQKPVSPLESNIIELARSKGSMVDLGSRTIFNYMGFSLMVQNPPHADQWGELREIVQMICRAFEKQLPRVQSAELDKQQRDRVLMTLDALLEQIESRFKVLQQGSTLVLENLSDRLASELPKLDLLGYQEDILYKLIQQSRDRVMATPQEELALMQKFELLRKQVNNLGVTSHA